MPQDSDPDPLLNTLVERCLERLEREGSGVVEDLCREQPELAEGLRRRLARLERLGLLPLEQGPGQTAADLPESIGGYRLLELLGEGGMGVVYRAFDPNLSREVALKLLRPERLLHPGARTRFLREAEAAARLAHPGIVAIHGAGEHRVDGATAGVPFLALELVEGESLAQVLRRVGDREPDQLTAADIVRPLRQADGAGSADGWTQAVIRIVRDVARALAHAHERGVLHRDVKPSNIMLDPAGRARLLDFGLARALGDAKTTRTGVAVGSLEYMAPEQLAAGSADLDGRVDVFGLGATLYELLTLRSPFQAGTPEQTMQRIREGTYTAPRKLVPGLTREVEAVCCQALSVTPAKRYASAEGFARDLDNLLALRPVAARRPGPLRRALALQRRRPELRAALLVATLAVVGLPLAIGWRDARHARELERTADRVERTEARLNDLFAVLFEAVDPGVLDHAAALDSFERLAQAGSEAAAEGGLELDNVERLVRLAGEGLARGAWEPARIALESALERLESGSELDPQAAGSLRLAALHTLGALELQLGDLAGAEQSMARLLQLDTELPQAAPPDPRRTARAASVANVRAGLALKAGRPDAALEFVAAGLSRLAENPESGPALRTRALLLEQRARIERSVGRPQAAHDSALAAVAATQALREQHPAAFDPADLSSGLRVLGDAEGALGDPQAQLRRLDEAALALGLVGPDADLPSDAGTDLVYERAAVLVRSAEVLGRLDRAVTARERAEWADRELERAVERFDESPKLLGQLAAMWTNLGAFWTDADDMQRAAACGRRSAELLERLGEREQIAPALREVWRLEAATVRYHLGVGRSEVGDAAGAIEDYRKVLDGTDPASTVPQVLELRGLAQLELGVQLEVSGEFDAAHAAFDASEQMFDALDRSAAPGPRAMALRSSLARCRANAWIDAGEPERAALCYEAWSAPLAEACGRFPGAEGLAAERREQLQSIVFLWRQADRPERTRAALGRLEQLGRGDPAAAELARDTARYLERSGFELVPE